MRSLSPVRPFALAAAVLNHFATGAEVEAGQLPIQHHLRMPRQVGARLSIPTALHVAGLVKSLFTSLGSMNWLDSIFSPSLVFVT